MILNGKYIISAQGGTVCFKDTIKNHGTVPVNVTIIDNLTIFLLHALDSRNTWVLLQKFQLSSN